MVVVVVVFHRIHVHKQVQESGLCSMGLGVFQGYSAVRTMPNTTHTYIFQSNTRLLK